MTGRRRITSTTQFGRRCLLPDIVALQSIHLGLEVDLHLANSFVDLAANKFDLAIRAGFFAETACVARLLVPITPLIVAALSYLAAQGIPATTDDLAASRLIGFRALDID